ncbi:MAG: molybdopterin-dependent oxidoreductase [bacterium]
MPASRPWSRSRASATAFDTLVNEGWDGRLYTDLAKLDRGRLATPTASFYVRTRFPDRLDLAARTPWQIAVDGRVPTPHALALDALLPAARPMGTHVMECSGNSRGAHFGLMSAAAWAGIPMAEVLDRLDWLPDATRLEVVGFDDHSVPSANGHSTPGASWIFSFDQLVAQGAFLATGMNGEALPLDHGFPVRLVVPGWYGCTCIKWLE